MTTNAKWPSSSANAQPDRLDEIAFVVALDEMRHRLGVGLGREGVAVSEQAGRELAVVLDDAVQDDRELRRIAAGERVRVRLGDGAVRRPACVRDARGRSRRVGAGEGLQVVEGADRAHVVETVALEEGETR